MGLVKLWETDAPFFHDTLVDRVSERHYDAPALNQLFGPFVLI